MSVVSTGGAKLMSKGFGLGGVINLALNIAPPIFEYRGDIKEGKSKAASFMRAGAEFIGWQVAAPVMFGKMAMDIGSAATEAGIIAGKRNLGTMRSAYKANFGGSYTDSEKAATMRQAGMMNINASKSNVRSGLGGEAKQYYRRDMSGTW